jgi:hypothetical protein
MLKKLLTLSLIALFSFLAAGCHSVAIQQTSVGKQAVATLKRGYPILVASREYNDYLDRRTCAFAEKFFRIYPREYGSKVYRARHPESLKDALSDAYQRQAKYLFYLEIPEGETSGADSSGHPFHEVLEVSVYNADSGHRLMRKELASTGKNEFSVKQTEVAVKAFCRQIFR